MRFTQDRTYGYMDIHMLSHGKHRLLGFWSRHRRTLRLQGAKCQLGETNESLTEENHGKLMVQMESRKHRTWQKCAEVMVGGI